MYFRDPALLFRASGDASCGSFNKEVFSGETVVFFSILALVTIILVSGRILLLRAARRLPHDPSPAVKARRAAKGKRYGRTFGLVFGLNEVATLRLAGIPSPFS
jgi:hypothetical protein